MTFKYTVGALCGLSALAAAGPLSAKQDDKLCAGYFDKQVVRNAYFGWGGNPTAPMAIPSHTLRVVESKVTSSFNDRQAIGTPATEDRFKQVWQSIDTWGAEEKVSAVITVDGWHAFAFPVTVPMTRKVEHAAGFYDVFSADEKQVRGHINPDEVSLIYATHLPAGNGTAQRAISFYGPGGDLIIGLYATEGNKVQNPKLIEGFNRTWELIKSMPRACAK